MWKTALLVTVLLSSACVNGGAADPCAGWKPIILTDVAIEAMTEAEAAEILAHNEFGAARCKWKPE